MNKFEYPLILSSYRSFPLNGCPPVPISIKKLVLIPESIEFQETNRVKLVCKENHRIPSGELQYLYPDSFLSEEEFCKTIINYDTTSINYSLYRIKSDTDNLRLFFVSKNKKFVFTKEDFAIVIEDIINPLMEKYKEEEEFELKLRKIKQDLEKLK